MEQFPLRGPKDGAISLHALSTSAAISIAPLKHACEGGSMRVKGVQWKLHYPEALAMEIAP